MDRRRHGLTDHTVEKRSNETRTTFFSEHREVGGLKLPFRALSTNGEKQYDQVVIYEGYEINPAVEAARFEAPQRKTDDFSIAGGARSLTVPFDLINNHIYIDAVVEGPAAPHPARHRRRQYRHARGRAGAGARSGSATPSSATRSSTSCRSSTWTRSRGRLRGHPGPRVLPPLRGADRLRPAAPDPDPAGRLPAAGRRHGRAFTFDEQTPQVEGKIDGIPGKF